MTARAWVLLAVASALWGIPYLLIKILVEDGVPVAVVAFGRCAIGAAVLLPVAWRMGALRGLAGRRRELTVLALLDMSAPFLLITAGERHVPSSFAGILIASVPLLVAVLALRYDHSERVDRTRLGGLLVGMLGVGLLLGVEVSGDPAALGGGALILVASGLYAGAALYVKRSFPDVSPIGIVTGTLVAACVTLAPLAAIQAPGTPDADVGWVGALAALGVLCSALAYLAYYALVAMVGAGRASLNTYLSPAIAAVAGIVFLNESLGAAALAGMVLIFAGAWMSSGGRPPGQLARMAAAASRRPSATTSGAGTWPGSELRSPT